MKGKYIIVPVALLLVLVIVLFCQVFNIQSVKIVVEGSIAITEEELIQKSGIELRTSIFTLSKETVKKSLENSFSEGSVSVDRVEKVFPNTVKVYVRNRSPLLAISLADGTGVVPTDRDFQLVAIKQESEVDFNKTIKVSGISVVNSFDTDQFIFLRKVVYAFFRAGFSESGLVAFVKEFRFENDKLYADLKTENSVLEIGLIDKSYESVVKTVKGVYANFLSVAEKERSAKHYPTRLMWQNPSLT